MTRNVNHQSQLLNLELLGIGSLRYQSVKQNLEIALQDMDLDIPINEIKDIEKILECDIIGIPALRINQTIVFQNVVPSIDEIKASIIPLLENSLPSTKDSE